MELTYDEMHLIRWLIAGHPNQKDEDVQKLNRKMERLLNKPTKIPPPGTFIDTHA